MWNRKGRKRSSGQKEREILRKVKKKRSTTTIAALRFFFFLAPKPKFSREKDESRLVVSRRRSSVSHFYYVRVVVRIVALTHAFPYLHYIVLSFPHFLHPFSLLSFFLIILLMDRFITVDVYAFKTTLFGLEKGLAGNFNMTRKSDASFPDTRLCREMKQQKINRQSDPFFSVGLGALSLLSRGRGGVFCLLQI